MGDPVSASAAVDATAKAATDTAATVEATAPADISALSASSVAATVPDAATFAATDAAATAGTVGGTLGSGAGGGLPLEPTPGPGSAAASMGKTALTTFGPAVATSLLTPRPPKAPAPIAMPDPLAQQQAQREQLLRETAMRGRASTILTDPANAGTLGG